jgi:hypothetical protein
MFFPEYAVNHFRDELPIMVFPDVLSVMFSLRICCQLCFFPECAANNVFFQECAAANYVFFPECAANHSLSQNVLPIMCFPECANNHVFSQNVLSVMFCFNSVDSSPGRVK